MVACIRAVSQMPWPRQAEKARAILAELELVDPDLELAREVAVESCIGHSDGWANDVREGKHDDYGEVRAALAAIKRVRAEKG